MLVFCCIQRVVSSNCYIGGSGGIQTHATVGEERLFWANVKSCSSLPTGAAGVIELERIEECHEPLLARVVAGSHVVVAGSHFWNLSHAYCLHCSKSTVATVPQALGTVANVLFGQCCMHLPSFVVTNIVTMSLPRSWSTSIDHVNW